MQYDGTGTLTDALADLYGCSPRNHNKIAELVAEAKTALGMTSKARNLPIADRLAIYRWHYDRLNPVQDGKQKVVSDTGAGQSVDFPVASGNTPAEKIKPSIRIPAENTLKGNDGVIGNASPRGKAQTITPDNPVQNVKRASLVYDVKQDAPASLVNDDDTSVQVGLDDYGQIHFALSFDHQGQAKRTTVMLEGYLVKALQRRHGLGDNAAIRAWIEQAIKADGDRFDSAMPLTKQVKRMIIESFV
jgi:hypothetical protein